MLVTRRPEYACRGCAEGVAQAPAPVRLIAGGMPTEAMVAHVLVSKHAEHLPSQISAHQGPVSDRSTLADRGGHAARELRPVHARLVEFPKASPRLFCDGPKRPWRRPADRRESP